nr:NAC domain-containing protein [Tanacetum cinerariifolium]
MNHLLEMLNLINSNQDPPVDLYDLKGSDEGNNEIDSLTKEPFDTLFTGDEFISTTLERENDEFIKSSVDDLVPILRELEVTSVCDDLERICSRLFDGNVDVADLPRHLVKQLFSHLVKNPSLTKRMSDEPLGDDSKPRSYDVTFSNPLFNFNDDFTLCNDNPLFDEEFEDISSMDPPNSAPLIYEPLGNPDSVSRSLETSDLILEELTAEIGLDDSISIEIDDGYYDSEGDILFLEHLLIE